MRLMEQVATVLSTIKRLLLQVIQQRSYQTNLWILNGGNEAVLKAKMLHEQSFNIQEWFDPSIMLHPTNNQKNKLAKQSLSRKVTQLSFQVPMLTS